MRSCSPPAVCTRASGDGSRAAFWPRWCPPRARLARAVTPNRLPRAERGRRMAEGKGLSVGRLQRLHDAMTRYVERGELAGVAMLVARHGQVWVDSVGCQDR